MKTTTALNDPTLGENFYRDFYAPIMGVAFKGLEPWLTEAAGTVQYTTDVTAKEESLHFGPSHPAWLNLNAYQ